MERKRVDMWIPLNILEAVERYQEENGINSRTGAFLELVRLGLLMAEQQKKDGQE